MLVEEYELEKLQSYPKDYLIEIIKWQKQNLHQQADNEEGEGQHIECESCTEAYEIEKVMNGKYSYEYIQNLYIWLHETLKLNCRGK